MADYGGASQRQNALRLLERLESSGAELTPGETKALADLRASSAADRDEIGATKAAYTAFGNNLGFNAPDEIGSLYKSMRDGTTFAEEQAKTKEEFDRMSAAHPEAWRTGEIAGTLSSMAIPGIGTVAAARKLPMLWKMAAGGAGMGTAGAVQGALSGWTEQERIDNAKKYGAISAGAGALAPLAAAGAGKVVGALTKPKGREAARLAGATGAAGRKLQRSFDADNLTGEVQQYLDRLGPEAMLADAGPNMQQRAMGLASMPGEGSRVVSDAIGGRAKDAGGRITRTLDSAIGPEDVAIMERDAQIAARKATSPMYDAAKATPGNMDVTGVQASIKARLPHVGSDTRADLEKLLGNISGDVSAEKLHNVRSDLWGEIQALKRQGKYTGEHSKALEAIDAELDKVPGYKDARAQWADSKKVDDALDRGFNALDGGKTASRPIEFERELAALSPPEREAVKKGIRDRVAVMMGTARNDPAAAKRLLDTGFNREKLRIALGDAEAEQIIRRIDAEIAFTDTNSRVLQGSMTQFRKEAADDLADIRAPDTLNRPGPVGRAKQSVNNTMNNIVDALLFSGREKTGAGLAKMLTAQGADRDAIVRALVAEHARNAPTSALRDMQTRKLLDVLLKSGGGVLAEQATNGP